MLWDISVEREAVGVIAHTERSSNKNLGAFPLADLCNELEMKSWNEAIDAVFQFTVGVDEVCGRMNSSGEGSGKGGLSWC
jgi:hypothetical protein